MQDFKQALSKEYVERMGKEYGFAKSGNVEIVSRYFGVGLRAKDRAVYGPTAELLGKVGRMKFVRTLCVFFFLPVRRLLSPENACLADISFDRCRFRQLNAVDRELAVETFEKNKDFYHPICRGQVEKDLFGKK